MTRATASPVFVTLLFLLSSCDRPVDPDLSGQLRRAAAVTFAAPSLDVAPGQSLPLDVEVRDSEDRPLPAAVLTWQSSDSAVATVSSSGVLTTKRWGSATITAAVDDVVAQLPIVVYGAGFHAWPDTASMLPGGTQQVAARAINGLGHPRTLSGTVWETSDADVARVDANGLVTAVGVGHATVTGVVGEVRMSSEVSVFTYAAPLRFESLTGDRQTCGLTPDGRAYCWGLYLDEVGTDQPADRCESINPTSNHGHVSRWPRRCSDLPVGVGRDLRFVALSAGYYQICGITSSGSLYCWSRDTLPTHLAVGVTFRSVSVGNGAACAVSTSNQGYCWGDNGAGVLGNGTTTSTSVPTLVSGGLEFASIDLSYGHACGVTVEGDGYCWGRNVDGELGVQGPPEVCGRVDCSRLPIRVEGNLKFKSIEAGTFFSCGLDLNSHAHCWGTSYHGPGGPTYDRVPKPISGNIAFEQLSVNSHYACGLDASGFAYCWRANTDTGAVLTPTRLTGFTSPMRSIHEESTICGIRTDGVTICQTMMTPRTPEPVPGQ